MRTLFCDILPAMLKREGLYDNDPVDRGGETYKGIARNFHPDWEGWEIIDSYKDHPNFPAILEEVKALQRKVASFYEAEFWEPSKASRLPEHLREFYFDMCVNHGQGRAVKILQKACVSERLDIGKWGPNNDGVDGDIGDDTISALPHLKLRDAVRQRLFFYNEIIENDPSQMRFRKGWYNRTLDFLG